MKSIDYIIIVIVAIIMYGAFKASSSHMKGEGACCGGKDTIIPEPDKKLDKPIIGKISYNVDGMTCMNCSNRIKRALNKIDGVSAQVNLKKNTVLIEFCEDIDKAIFVQTIERLGYKIK